MIQSTLAAELVGAAEAVSVSGVNTIFPGAEPSQVPVLATVAPPVIPPGKPPSFSSLFDDDGPRIRFPVIEDAIERLNNTKVFVGSDFRETAQRAKRGIFSITADLKQETVVDIRQIFTENIRKETSAKQFVKDVTDLLDEGTGLSEARLNMVFRNNMQQAFSDGADRAVEKPLVADFFPYRVYFATTDARVRPEHIKLEKLGLDGTAVYRADDPVWKLFRPPWDFNCRCSWAPMSVKRAARRGVKEAVDWWARATAMAKEEGGRAAIYLSRTKPTNPQFVKMPKFQPSPEFKREIV